MISVIIPVYNAEKTIRRCVESLLFGKEQDIEVILVDDCSKDKSWDICCSLQDMDKRVRAVRNEENSGVSATRNHGLRAAVGDFIAFADSDDWCSYNFLADLLEMQHCYPEFMPVCGFMFRDHVNNFQAEYLFCKAARWSIVERTDLFELLGCVHLQMVWNKLFRSDIISRSQLQFDKFQSMGEDFQFVLDYLKRGGIQQFAVINKALYHYIRYNSTSLMGTASSSWENDVGRIRQLIDITGESKQKLSQCIYELKNGRLYHLVRSKKKTMCQKLSGIAELFDESKANAFVRYIKELPQVYKEKLLRNIGAIRYFLARIKGRIKREILTCRIKNIKRRFKCDNLTVFSQNCIGGVFSHDMGWEFLSPTVNLFFSAHDFLKFAAAPQHYLAQPLKMRWAEEYPVGDLGDICVHFMHYSTCTEAKEAWERRTVRVDFNRFIAISVDRDGFGDEEFKMWLDLKCPKILYTCHKKYAIDENVVYLAQYEGLPCVPDIIPSREFYQDGTLVKICKQSNFIGCFV